MNSKERTKDLTGQRFGRWLVIEKTGVNKYRQSTWRVKCDCGTEKVLAGAALTRKRSPSRSCSCGVKRRIKHGLVDHPLYETWEAMKQRCLNEKHPSFHRYGGRGIRIWEKWKNNPEKFVYWCLNNGWEKGLEIDREDNDSGYFPENCRFVGRTENNLNRTTRRDKNTGRFLSL